VFCDYTQIGYSSRTCIGFITKKDVYVMPTTDWHMTALIRST